MRVHECQCNDIIGLVVNENDKATQIEGAALLAIHAAAHPK